MNKEKRIEEMAKVMCGGCADGKECMQCLCADWYKAEKLYNTGCRKQSEGEWVSNRQTDEYICSLCGGIAPVDCEKENFYKSNYCPNCGASMKGGE